KFRVLIEFNKLLSEFKNRNTLLLWSLFSVAGSLIAFGDYYIDIIILLGNWSFLMEEGSYPFVMLSLLITWLLLSRRAFFSLLKQENVNLHLNTITLLGLLISVSALTIKLIITNPAPPTQLILLLSYFQGLFMMLFPKSGTITLLLLAMYIPTATLPQIISTYFDKQISLAFIKILEPILHTLGYQFQSVNQSIILNTQYGREVYININSACVGIASYSIFLLLNGIMILHLKVDKKKVVLQTLSGIATLLLLNIIRLITIVNVGYINREAINLVHNTLGYTIFTLFYILYMWIFLRSRQQKRNLIRNISSNQPVHPSPE
ncbi:MAG: archaeosortase/exosortase family protein, partial [Candidatus Bathyarchaeia archaeon]